jgi:multiple sugar transport system permease protein
VNPVHPVGSTRESRGYRRSAVGTPGRRLGYLAPLVLIMALTSLVPVVYALYLSFFNWNWGSRFSFIGFDNYVRTLSDGVFWAAFVRTGIFSMVAVAIELVLGFALALATHSVSRGVGWLRTVLIVPLMVSGIVVSLIWKVMLDPTLGIIPFLLGRIGIHSVDLLGNANLALPTVSGLDAWWQTGFVFIILNAGLAALPTEPFEAAAVDGASAWQRFRFITLPLMTPLILTVAGIRMVDCLKVFALVFGTTDGGPGHSTETTQFLAYRTAFKEFAISEAMTMMVVYAGIIITFVVIGLIVRKALHHEK